MANVKRIASASGNFMANSPLAEGKLIKSIRDTRSQDVLGKLMPGVQGLGAVTKDYVKNVQKLKAESQHLVDSNATNRLKTYMQMSTRAYSPTLNSTNNNKMMTKMEGDMKAHWIKTCTENGVSDNFKQLGFDRIQDQMLATRDQTDLTVIQLGVKQDQLQTTNSKMQSVANGSPDKVYEFAKHQEEMGYTVEEGENKKAYSKAFTNKLTGLIIQGGNWQGMQDSIENMQRVATGAKPKFFKHKLPDGTEVYVSKEDAQKAVQDLKKRQSEINFNAQNAIQQAYADKIDGKDVNIKQVIDEQKRNLSPDHYNKLMGSYQKSINNQTTEGDGDVETYVNIYSNLIQLPDAQNSYQTRTTATRKLNEINTNPNLSDKQRTTLSGLVMSWVKSSTEYKSLTTIPRVIKQTLTASGNTLSKTEIVGFEQAINTALSMMNPADKNTYEEIKKITENMIAPANYGSGVKYRYQLDTISDAKRDRKFLEKEYGGKQPKYLPQNLKKQFPESEITYTSSDNVYHVKRSGNVVEDYDIYGNFIGGTNDPNRVITEPIKE